MNIKSYFSAIISALFFCIFNSCQSDLDFVDESDCEVCNLIFDVPCPGFVDEVGTRAKGSNWEEGDQIFIRFSSTVYGTGEYSKGDWDFKPNTKLHTITGAQCSIYYFKGKNVTSIGEKVTFDANTCVYGTKTALYSYNNGDLVVSATLTPMVSRIRFKGEIGSKIKVSSNFLQYNSYSFNSDELSSGPCNMTLSVNTNGYTDYLYVTAEDDIQLSLDTKRYNFTKTFKKSLFVNGLSGMIQIPSESIYDGWKKKELPRAVLLRGSSFNGAIKTLAHGSSNLDWTTEDELVKSIVVKCNSQVTTNTLVSDRSSSVPIYASYSDGMITLYTSAQDIYVDDMRLMFTHFTRINTLDMSYFDTSDVTDMGQMFAFCSGLTTIDLSHFDTSNVTDMGGMFWGCSGLTTIDLSHFDTSKVTYMGSMFADCSGLTTIDLSHFDTSNVTGMVSMFRGCSRLTTIDLSHFETSKVTYMSSMFSGCSRLTTIDLSHFDTSNVILMAGLFYGCSGLTTIDLSHFDTSNVTSMASMFRGCNRLKSLILSHKFIVNNSTTISFMFQDFASSSKYCTITCTQGTKSKFLSSNTYLNSSYISWKII